MTTVSRQEQFVLWFEDLSLDDLALVGGKNASLGVLSRDLEQDGIRVPPGFALTTRAFRAFLADNGLDAHIGDTLKAFQAGRMTLKQSGKAIRNRILSAPMPERIRHEIERNYIELAHRIGHRIPPVAVRSSATAEDLPGASFAGQHESFLNIRGREPLVEACRRCFASLFTDRAIAYREAKGFDHLSVAVSVGVQQMVRSDKAGAGVIFTLDTETGFPDVVQISAAWGLGETVVQGQVEPDRYVVFKPLLDKARASPIISRKCGSKSVTLVYGRSEGQPTRLINTPAPERVRRVLGDEEILQLARWGAAIERRYGKPMDIEWAKDGVSGELFIVQARPETVKAGADRSAMRRYTLAETQQTWSSPLRSVFEQIGFYPLHHPPGPPRRHGSRQ